MASRILSQVDKWNYTKDLSLDLPTSSWATSDTLPWIRWPELHATVDQFGLSTNRQYVSPEG